MAWPYSKAWGRGIQDLKVLMSAIMCAINERYDAVGLVGIYAVEFWVSETEKKKYPLPADFDGFPLYGGKKLAENMQKIRSAIQAMSDGFEHVPEDSRLGSWNIYFLKGVNGDEVWTFEDMQAEVGDFPYTYNGTRYQNLTEWIRFRDALDLLLYAKIESEAQCRGGVADGGHVDRYELVGDPPAYEFVAGAGQSAWDQFLLSSTSDENVQTGLTLDGGCTAYLKPPLTPSVRFYGTKTARFYFGTGTLVDGTPTSIPFDVALITKSSMTVQSRSGSTLNPGPSHTAEIGGCEHTVTSTLTEETLLDPVVASSSVGAYVDAEFQFAETLPYTYGSGEDEYDPADDTPGSTTVGTFVSAKNPIGNYAFQAWLNLIDALTDQAEES